MLGRFWVLGGESYQYKCLVALSCKTWPGYDGSSGPCYTFKDRVALQGVKPLATVVGKSASAQGVEPLASVSGSVRALAQASERLVTPSFCLGVRLRVCRGFPQASEPLASP